jgi:hypothetical protein
MKYKNPIVLVLPLLLLASCSGSGDGSTVGTSSDYVVSSISGQFIDAPVVGLNYSSTSHSGVTGTNGSYQCALGEEVTFKLGANHTIGKAGCGKKIFLDSLDTKAAKGTIGAVLQSFGISGGVITIPVAARTVNLPTISLASATNDTAIGAFVTSLNTQLSLSLSPVTKTVAIAHIDTVRESNISFDATLKSALDELAWFTQADGNNTNLEPARYNISEDVHIVKNENTDCEIDFYMSLYKKINNTVEEYYVLAYTATNLPSADGQRLMSDVFSSQFSVTESNNAVYAGNISAYLDVSNKKLKGQLKYTVSLGGQSKTCSAVINEKLK